MPTRTLLVASVAFLCAHAGSLAQPAPTAAAPASEAAAPAAPDPTLLIGKPPPPFTVAKWVKGESLAGFQKGTVYVVDFWATWCGPCKAAIPHLSKLAQEHKGKVEVVGVSISERQSTPEDTAYIDLVQKFVDKQAERMDYRVAVDTPDKKMHAAWFKPAGTGGIPTAYIIDQNGLVAWTGIGSPRTIERIVGQVLAGTFDPKKEAEQQAREDAEAKQRAEADIAAARERNKDAANKYPGYHEAMERNDPAAALEALNAAFKADPDSETSGAYQWKFMLLMRRNKPEEVNAYVRELLQKYPDNSDVIGFASACIVATSEDAPRFDSALALEAAKKTAAAAKPDSRWQQFALWRLGWASYHAGAKADAIKHMEAALDGVKRLKDKFDFNDLDMQCEEALTLFRKTATEK